MFDDRPALFQATTAEECEQVRSLFAEYQQAIGVDLCFQGFEAELASLPGDYAPPHGRLLLARWGDALAGCGALRRLSGSTCEMKRLYVRPRFAGRGLGRQLVRALIEQAQREGYQAMKLDTLPSMERAQALYESLGFRKTAPYCFNPVPGALYFELDLRAAPIP